MNGKFEQYLKEKGLVVVGSTQESECLGESRSLLELICSRRATFVPWLAKAAIYIRGHAKDLKCFVSKVEGVTVDVLKLFLEKLKENGLVLRYELLGEDVGIRSIVAFPEDSDRLSFYRSKWAEICFRRLFRQVVENYLHQTNQNLPYRLLNNIKVAKKGETKRILTELDLVLEMGERFYVVEVKSGPWIRILQWAQKECLFKDSQTRVITCTTYPGIPSEIFAPQILLTFNTFESAFLRILENDFKVKTPKTLEIEAMWKEHDNLWSNADEKVDVRDERPEMCEEDVMPFREDARMLVERLNTDVFHIRPRVDHLSHLVRGYDGECYDDYDMNAYLDD